MPGTDDLTVMGHLDQALEGQAGIRSSGDCLDGPTQGGSRLELKWHSCPELGKAPGSCLQKDGT